MKKNLLLIAFFFSFGAHIFATHNRAGEITYECLGGYTYKIRVTTYTNTNNTNADRCELIVFFGDGTSDANVPRINGPSGTGLCPQGKHDGQMISSDTKLNIYEVIHTYPGPGNYSITMDDQNRNQGICNIINSVQQSFTLITELKINPFLPCNSSPVLLNPPLDDACVGVCFEHNPGAYDPDGDSLHYSLTSCYAYGTPILGYTMPNDPSNGSGGNLSIDPLTGDLVWCAPTKQCQYNVAILIKEYKLLPGTNQRYYVGSILRDMQIDVGTCNNTPPDIKNINDTCVMVGENLNFNVIATDQQLPSVLTLSASGGPFQLNNPATFISAPSTSPDTGTFNWTPGCDAIRLLPYLVTFKASDDGFPASAPLLVDFESVFIKVIAPAPTGLTATPAGASIVLNWNAASCNSVTGNNPFTGYLIYRKNSCDSFAPAACETGVPAYTGYTQVGSTNATTTTFTDNNGGQGLIHGVDYSYIVVACYADGSQSYASINACAHLVRDVPIITNVSVISTGTNDSVWTHWVKPLATVPNLDTIANPPPYEYRLMQAQGFLGNLTYSLIATYSYSAYWQLTDTGFVSDALDTEGNPYTYRVDFYADSVLKGSTHTASSVFLSSAPANKKVRLAWKEFVPWNNYKYFIYKEIPTGSLSFTLIDSTTTKSYVDTGLVNGITYCYKIISEGVYSDTSLPRPLFNHSQIKCEIPIDTIPPCQPNFTVTNDCDILQTIISWTNPNTYCSDDAVQYNIYFAPTTSDPLKLIYSSTDMNNTTYSVPVYYYEGVPSVAGCYAVTAVDSAAIPNESYIVTKICVDNCPVYELPNVFTPNDDHHNDLFMPLLPYRFIKDIDITIYDRWGLVMFETTDPDILWDGKNRDTKGVCPDGVYYYVCTVNEIRVEGIKPRVLKGFIQLLQENKTGTSQ